MSTAEMTRMSTETATPRVSIVVPLFNCEEYVRESLDSILAQTFCDFEVVVVDDASTDSSGEIVSSYDDPRLRYFRQSTNLGIFPNLDDGIARARGSLIAFYHSDDVYAPAIVERQVAYLDDHPEVGAVFAIDTFITPDGVEYGRLDLPSEFRQSRPLRYAEVLNGVFRHGNTFIRGQTSMVRRDVYQRVGSFDARYDLRADLDMWLRIAAAAPIAILPEYLMAYRWGHSNSSARYGRLRTDPEFTFALLDGVLATEARALVESDALRAYEARRVEDLLVVTANRYAVGDRQAARRSLATTSPRRLVASRRIERWRLLVLWGLLSVATRLPRFPRLGDALGRRFEGGR
jgi:GT2 family glycosyltransferase